MLTTDEGMRRFQRIAQDLREQITSGQLAAGDHIPSVRDLVETWGTSKVTVDRAVALLRAEGLIETRVGTRTTVTDRGGRPWVSTPRDHVERVRDGGPIYAAGETSRFFQLGVISTLNVAPVVVSAVGLPVPDPRMPTESTMIVQRARVMLRDDVITGTCTTWFNYPLIIQQGPAGAELVERLTSRDERYPEGTRVPVAQLFGVEHTSTVDKVGVRGVPTLVARELGVEPGTPMLWVLSTRFAGEYVLEVDEWFRYPDDDVTYQY